MLNPLLPALQFDCRQILLTFSNMEEWPQILTEDRHWFQGQALAGTLDAEAWARQMVPDARPTWKFNTVEVRGEATISCHPLTWAHSGS
jgi:hypothetical protein